jgi:hypothetical protein
MSVGGRAGARARILRRAGWVAGILVVLALLLLFNGSYVLGVIVAAVAAVAIWLFLQARSVR